MAKHADTGSFGPGATAGLRPADDPAVDGLMAVLRKAFDVPLAVVETAPPAAGDGADRDPVMRALARLPCDADALVLVPDAARDPRCAGARVGPAGPPLGFFAGVPLRTASGDAIGALCLLDGRPRRLTSDDAALLVRMGAVASALLERSRSTPPSVAPAAFDDRAGAAARLRSLYERTSALARIGVWHCDLSTEALTWTDGLYDLFDLPHGAPLTRAFTKSFYEEGSLREMERLRSRAIAERNGFTLDIRVVTAKGQPRWIRLSAEVECEAGVPVRMFGLQQDITPDKDQIGRLRDQAERDFLTGLANRSVVEARLDRTDRPPSAVLIIDVDRFKQVNDTFGHAAGDECLRRVGEAIRSTFGHEGLAARLGGDEFAVVLDGDRTAAAIADGVERLMLRSRHTIARDGHSLAVSLSVGAAVDVDRRGTGGAALLRLADGALYAAKRAGRDTFRMVGAGPHLPTAPDRSASADTGGPRQSVVPGGL